MALTFPSWPSQTPPWATGKWKGFSGLPSKNKEKIHITWYDNRSPSWPIDPHLLVFSSCVVPSHTESQLDITQWSMENMCDFYGLLWKKSATTWLGHSRSHRKRSKWRGTNLPTSARQQHVWAIWEMYLWATVKPSDNSSPIQHLTPISWETWARTAQSSDW